MPIVKISGLALILEDYQRKKMQANGQAVTVQ